MIANCSAACIGWYERRDERERADRDLLGLAREDRQELLGAGVVALGAPVAVRHLQRVEAGLLGDDALLDHLLERAVHVLGRRHRLVVGALVDVDEVSDSHARLLRLVGTASEILRTASGLFGPVGGSGHHEGSPQAVSHCLSGQCAPRGERIRWRHAELPGLRDGARRRRGKAPRAADGRPSEAGGPVRRQLSPDRLRALEPRQRRPAPDRGADAVQEREPRPSHRHHLAAVAAARELRHARPRADAPRPQLVSRARPTRSTRT